MGEHRTIRRGRGWGWTYERLSGTGSEENECMRMWAGHLTNEGVRRTNPETLVRAMSEPDGADRMSSTGEANEEIF